MTLPPRSGIAVPLPGPDADLFTAICTICDGQPTRADFDRLERMLQDPAAMTVYLAVTDLDAAVRWKLRGRTQWQPPLADCGKSLPPQDAAIGNPENPQRFRVLPKWKKAMDGFFHGQLDTPARLSGRGVRRGPTPTGLAPLESPDRPVASRPVAPSTPVAPAPARQPRPAAAGMSLQRVAQLIVMLLTTLTIGGGIFLFLANNSPERALKPRPRLPGSVACVMSLHDVARSETATDSVAAVQPDICLSLFPGQRLSLGRGLVELAFDSGARLILEGPVAVDIVSAAAVRLDRGRLTATVTTVPGQTTSPRFTVETPTATVTDIGTSFGVAVSEAGLTDVSVFDGLVDLLPRLSVAADPAVAANPIRLAAGESAALTAPGKVFRRLSSSPIEFRRSMPKGSPSAPPGPAPVPWEDERAVAIYRDAFKGSGQLAGSSPSGGSGTGDVAWTAPAKNWNLTPDGLSAAARGKAALPFTPQPGRIYRLEAEVNVTAGGNDWAAIGFSGPADPGDPAMTAVWILQRESTDLDPNLMFFGSGTQNLRPITGDLRTGRRRLAVLLDTTHSEWTVTFLADGRPLGGGVLPAGTHIETVCLACQGQASVECRTFSLLVMESPDETHP